VDAAQRALDQVEPSVGDVRRRRAIGCERLLTWGGEIAWLPVRRQAFYEMDCGIVAHAGQDGDQRLLDTGDRTAVLGNLDSAAQRLLKLGRAPRRTAIADQCDRGLADDQRGAVAAQPADADAVPFEQPHDRVDPAQRVEQVFETDLGRPVCQR
jgi:hypothetical protein